MRIDTQEDELFRFTAITVILIKTIIKQMLLAVFYR